MRVECPRTEMFQLLLTGQLAPEQQGPLADHAATCPDCHAVVETMVTQRGHAPVDPRRPAPGQVIGGRFRLDQMIGAGGMGLVMAATHLELGHRVAIKFMREDRLGSGVTAERFIREARAVVKLRTEHVCRVLDVARLETGAPYIVMEFLDGVDLARTIAQRPLPATIAVEYAMQAMIALAEAHAAGIVHRDLKPGNLFVIRRPDGGPLVKVLDFGIAKALDGGDARLTRTRAMLGSPGYMSPEQLESARDVDARADVWALGVTLYQLLSGRLPFPARNATEIAVKIAVEPPEPIDLDPRLRAVVLRCLEKPVDARYPDVVALAADLAPFGGPRARQIAGMVAGVARQPVAMSTPQGVPAVAMHAPTAASVASSVAGSVAASAAAPIAPAAASRVAQMAPHPAAAAAPAAEPPVMSSWRTRPWRFGVPALALVVGIATVGVIAAVRGGGSDASRRPPAAPPSPPPIPAPAAPAPVVAATVPGDAADPPAIDAAAPAPAPASAADRTAPDPSGPGAQRTRPLTLAEVAAERKQECEALTRPPKAATAPAASLVECWCELHDLAHAAAALARITRPRERDGVRDYCAQRGIDLP